MVFVKKIDKKLPVVQYTVPRGQTDYLLLHLVTLTGRLFPKQSAFFSAICFYCIGSFSFLGWMNTL